MYQKRVLHSAALTGANVFDIGILETFINWLVYTFLHELVYN